MPVTCETLDDAPGASSAEPHLLALLSSPGVLLTDMQAFLKLHPKYRWCATTKHQAYTSWCKAAMAHSCSVNAVQFCAAPQEYPELSIARTWERAANVPVDQHTPISFPLVPNTKNNAQQTYVDGNCQATAQKFDDTVNQQQQALLAQNTESTALAQFLCMQRGKIQELVSNEKTIVRDNMTAHESWDRSAKRRRFDQIMSTPRRALDGATAFGITPKVAGTFGAASVASMAATAGLGGIGAGLGYLAGSRLAEAATGGKQQGVKRHLENEERERAIQKQATELQSPIDTIIWDCLTRTCDNLRLDPRTRVALAGELNRKNAQGDWHAGIQSFFNNGSTFKTVSVKNRQWEQMTPLTAPAGAVVARECRCQSSASI